MVSHGIIDVKRTRRRKLRYIITGEGHAHQRMFPGTFVCHTFQLYRQERHQAKDLLMGLKDTGIHTVRILDEGDVADVCRLTCMEYHFKLTDAIEAQSWWWMGWMYGLFSC